MRSPTGAGCTKYLVPRPPKVGKINGPKPIKGYFSNYFWGPGRAFLVFGFQGTPCECVRSRIIRSSDTHGWYSVLVASLGSFNDPFSVGFPTFKKRTTVPSNLRRRPTATKKHPHTLRRKHHASLILALQTLLFCPPKAFWVTENTGNFP